MKQTLDVAPLYASWDVLMNSMIEIHTAETQSEKSKAIRAHTAALLEHINTLDSVVPELESMSATPIPKLGVMPSTVAAIEQDYISTITTTIPL